MLNSNPQGDDESTLDFLRDYFAKDLSPSSESESEEDEAPDKNRQRTGVHPFSSEDILGETVPLLWTYFLDSPFDNIDSKMTFLEYISNTTKLSTKTVETYINEVHPSMSEDLQKQYARYCRHPDHITFSRAKSIHNRLQSELTAVLHKFELELVDLSNPIDSDRIRNSSEVMYFDWPNMEEVVEEGMKLNNERRESNRIWCGEQLTNYSEDKIQKAVKSGTSPDVDVRILSFNAQFHEIKEYIERTKKWPSRGVKTSYGMSMRTILTNIFHKEKSRKDRLKKSDLYKMKIAALSTIKYIENERGE